MLKLYSNISCLIIFLLACNAPRENNNVPDFNVPGHYKITCLQEAISDAVKPDILIRRKETLDSVFFIQQGIANCCINDDSLRLGIVNDTIQAIDISKSTIRSACDCICLFQYKVSLDRKFYEQSDKIVVINGKQAK